MSLQTILMPMFAQVALTFGLLFWMAYLRIGALRAGLTAPQAIALREPNWPPRATQIANAFHNQLETPLLFYALILISLQTETADSILLILSWLFVITRFAHAYVHVSSNRVDRRGALFIVGAIALALMWIIVFARIMLQPSGL
jgi:hypothetical protein